MEDILKSIEKWSEKYKFSFQFHGQDNNNVFIEKDGVEIFCRGGLESPADILKEALDFINRINPKKGVAFGDNIKKIFPPEGFIKFKLKTSPMIEYAEVLELYEINNGSFGFYHRVGTYKGSTPIDHVEKLKVFSSKEEMLKEKANKTLLEEF